MSNQSNGSATGAIVVAVILVALIIFCIFMAVKTSKPGRIMKRKNKLYRKAYKKGIFQSMTENLVHAAGLPIASGTTCIVNLTEKGLSISSSGTVFNIDIDKITDISAKTDREIQRSEQYVSSAGGAVAGALMFGIPGALIGGRTKKKKSISVTYSHFMIVTYKKDNTVDHIAFALPGSAMLATHFSNNYKLLSKNKSSTVVNL